VSLAQASLIGVDRTKTIRHPSLSRCHPSFRFGPSANWCHPWDPNWCHPSDEPNWGHRADESAKRPRGRIGAARLPNGATRHSKPGGFVTRATRQLNSREHPNRGHPSVEVVPNGATRQLKSRLPAGATRRSNTRGRNGGTRKLTSGERQAGATRQSNAGGLDEKLPPMIPTSSNFHEKL